MFDDTEGRLLPRRADDPPRPADEEVDEFVLQGGWKQQQAGG